jgi:hypothetical protein
MTPKPSGFVVHTAHSDGPGWFSISMFRQINHPDALHDADDPIVSIQIDRRHASFVGEHSRSSTDMIENIRTSDVDDLIAQLSDALAAARANGMLPPRIDPETYWAHREARRRMLEQLDAAGEEALALTDAAKESGYSANHLGRLVRSGEIENIGRSNAPKIRRRDLPRKATPFPSCSSLGIVSASGPRRLS